MANSVDKDKLTNEIRAAQVDQATMCRILAANIENGLADRPWAAYVCSDGTVTHYVPYGIPRCNGYTNTEIKREIRTLRGELLKLYKML